ncbi:MAG: hypothetical protein NDI60_03395 [Elusimicrobiales bacterium]|nr:hypothetical protein [Elusimicrobiales bacterium]
MEPVTNWRAFLVGVAAVAASGVYLARMLIRMHDRSGGDGDSDGRLLLDFCVIAGLLLLTIREFKVAFLAGLYP